MNRARLAACLQAKGVPGDLYSLDGGLWGDRLCIEQQGSLWYVYHSERGQRYDEEIFFAEEAGCERLYDRLTSGRMERFSRDRTAPPDDHA